jgi:hypothetical protein
MQIINHVTLLANNAHLEIANKQKGIDFLPMKETLSSKTTGSPGR